MQVKEGCCKAYQHCFAFSIFSSGLRLPLVLDTHWKVITTIEEVTLVGYSLSSPMFLSLTFLHFVCSFLPSPLSYSSTSNRVSRLASPLFSPDDYSRFLPHPLINLSFHALNNPSPSSSTPRDLPLPA